MVACACAATGPHVFIAGQTVPNADAEGMQSYTAQTKKVLTAVRMPPYTALDVCHRIMQVASSEHACMHACDVQVLKMLEAQLTAAGSSKSHMLKVCPDALDRAVFVNVTPCLKLAW